MGDVACVEVVWPCRQSRQGNGYQEKLLESIKHVKTFEFGEVIKKPKRAGGSMSLARCN